jgi:transcriptional regulator with XRE-family HTH domain
MQVKRFAEWVTTTRGGATQSSCAMRAGMTPQQWNQIEKQVKMPSVETVKRVALGLGADEREALVAAGYDTYSEQVDVRLARQIEPYLMRLRPDRRAAAERLLIDQARNLSELLTA